MEFLKIENLCKVYGKELCKNKFTVLAIYGIMAIRRYDHGRTNSYYAAIT